MKDEVKTNFVFRLILQPSLLLQEFFEPLDNFRRLRDHLFGQRVKFLAGYRRDRPVAAFLPLPKTLDL